MRGEEDTNEGRGGGVPASPSDPSGVRFAPSPETGGRLRPLQAPNANAVKSWRRFRANYGRPQWERDTDAASEGYEFHFASFHDVELFACSDGSWCVDFANTHEVSDLCQVKAASLEEAKDRATAAAINLLLWAENMARICVSVQSGERSSVPPSSADGTRAARDGVTDGTPSKEAATNTQEHR